MATCLSPAQVRNGEVSLGRLAVQLIGRAHRLEGLEGPRWEYRVLTARRPDPRAAKQQRERRLQSGTPPPSSTASSTAGARRNEVRFNAGVQRSHHSVQGAQERKGGKNYCEVLTNVSDQGYGEVRSGKVR